MDTAEDNLHRGWEYVHVAIDDHSRIAFIQILPTSRLLPLSPLARIGCLLRQPRNPHSSPSQR
jgi:hypothetical protein